ncbi:hypothetical protein LRH25_28295 [Ideonella azotifigens]|uniref:Phasin domain-containing protein n=1 Tax=Ideonella azotifigens TaxID=513160 RepID=A0ABN1KHU8_9BURK|nr:hypothetical protein [Ideonella azotifigens]MCD2344229.1 hypothetical protein [Ideonella azotifigens]
MSANRKTGAEEAPSSGEPHAGISAARVILGSSMALAQNLVDCAAQLQQQQAKSIDAFSVALDSALRDAEHAGDLPALMAIAAKLVNGQLALLMQQMGEGVSGWMEGEMQLARRLNSNAFALAQQLRSERAEPPVANGLDTSSLAQLGRFQDQWLATTQRWADAAGAAMPH